MLGKHAVLRPDDSVDIEDVFEPVHREIVDEGSDRLGVVSSRDADEPDLITELCLDRRDRAGFTTTGASPGSPEPENGVGSFERAEIELAAADGRENDRGCRARTEVGRRRCHCGLVFGAAGGGHQTQGHEQGENEVGPFGRGS